MGDPLSIAASAVTLVQLCTSVATSIYNFARETKHIEESVGALGEEIEGLRKILVGIARTFSNPIIATNLEEGIGKEHFLHVKVSLEDCKNTLERLNRIVRQVDAIDGSFWRLVKKRLKMYTKSEEIRLLQRRVEFIRQTMNISLQMITCSSVLANENHNENVNAKLDELKHIINRLSQAVRTEVSIRALTTTKPNKDSRVLIHLEDCLRSADVIVSNASSAGGTRSTVFGEGTSKASRVYDWIPHPAEHHGQAVQEPAPSSPSVTSTTQSAPLENPPPDNSDTDSDFDSFEPELIENWRTSGIQNFQLALYAEAQGDLERVLERSKRHYSNSSYKFRVEVLEMLALAYCRQRKWDKAETILLQFERGNDAKTLSNVHMLARIYLAKDELGKAEKFCKKAISGRKKTLGADHASYFLSIALLVRIYQQKGDRREAEAWQRFLPAESWMDEIQDIESLCCLSPSDAAAKVGEDFLKTFLRDDPQAEEKWQQIRANIRKGKEGLSGSGHGYNLLHAAAEHGHEMAACLLLELGPDINAGDRDGNTALHLAAQIHARIVQLILHMKPNINARSKTGRTPLIMAATSSNLETARLLVDKGAHVRFKDDFEWTALHYCAAAGNHDIAFLLLANGANINERGSGGWTPLHSAARKGNDKVVVTLIENGANVEARCSRNQTPLELARKHGYGTVVRLLQNASNIQRN